MHLQDKFVIGKIGEDDFVVGHLGLLGRLSV